MWKFFLGNWYWILGGLAAAILWVWIWKESVYNDGYEKGQTACQLVQATTQLEHTTERVKRDEKINRETPYTGDKSTRINWMRAFSTRP